MGVDTRRPILPAPTESSTYESNAESVVGTDLATNLSRVTDKTSYSIPDDGRPITINTTKRSDNRIGKLKKGGHQSQTSLLIEYFEGGKEGSDLKSKPSIRVKVTPSSRTRKSKEHDHLLVTETGGTRRPSLTRRISLGTSDSAGDNRSTSSLNLVTDGHNRHRRDPSVEVELLPRSDISGSSVSKDARYIVPESDISSMPADSMLEGTGPATAAAAGAAAAGAAMAAARPRRERSRSLSREDIALEKDSLKAPTRRRSRSLSRERLVTQKVIEKLGQKPRSSPTSKHRSSRSRSVSKEYLETDTRSPRRRRHRDEGSITGTESNLTGNSNSLLSANRPKSGDAYSFRSGTSKSSINNPKLLETVEDAIRRLILPELKELKKDQKVDKGRRIFDRDTDSSLVSGSSASREETTRRRSSSGKPRVVVNKDSRDSGELLSSSGRRRRLRKERDYDYDSPSERSYSRRESGDSTIVEDEKSHRKRRDHPLRDAAAGAIAGGVLTAAALKHHDSKSSVDKERRRKRRSKSRSSRSASIAESDEIFHKHEVPPMPMRSEIDSELTRSSLLSEQTSSTMTPTQKEVRHVARGSPMEVRSPAATTPTRSSGSLQHGFGTHHGNASRGDLSGKAQTESDSSVHSPEDAHRFEQGALAGVAGGLGTLAAHHMLEDEERVRRYEQNLHHQHPIRKGLSPIQSVASYREDTSEPARDSVLYQHSAGSTSSLGRRESLQEERSFGSLSSAHSIGLAKKRPLGVSLEKQGDVLAPHAGRLADQPDDVHSLDDWYDEEHRQNERYRDSFNSSDPRLDSKRTTYTDDSFDTPYSDRISAGQQVARGVANNPQFVTTAEGVESAVASLYDPSTVGTRSLQSSRDSVAEKLDTDALSPAPLNYGHRDVTTSEERASISPAAALNKNQRSFQERADVVSPPQSVTRSVEEKELPPQMGASGIPVADDPMPEIGHGLEESAESEITTNPSVIQGPIGGISHENRDHWPYDPTPPRSQADLMSPRSDKHGMSAAEAALAGGAVGAGLATAAAAAHGIGHDKDRVEAYNETYDPELAYDPNRDSYMSRETPRSPILQDEGYISGKPPTTGALTPDLKAKNNDLTSDDPFAGNNKHLSGLSHGMDSPLYDSATGQGVDRIQSKDIVALMDHLTVRDAHRNARDTEILVTLVRTAAEMRNSFLDIKRFIADQDEYVMDTADKQHEKTVQRIIGGPRPQPATAPRFQRTKSSEDAEDSSTKRRNIFKRALRGLGAKNNHELQNIEGMLMQLLDEVEGLRTAQEGHLPGRGAGSFDSTGNTRGTMDDGYDADGHAGTSSTGGDRSGFLSTNSSRQGVGFTPARRISGNQNRVSTVMEGDEDAESLRVHEQNVLGQDVMDEDNLLTPTHELRDSRENVRGSSVPLASPPRKPIPTSGALSNENTPRMSDDGKARKHKSSSSSFFPKISRWSKTTASSVGDTFRSSAQTKKERPYSQVSRSGSDLGEYPYDSTGDDRIRSNTSFQNGQRQENRPSSPLLPSQLSDNPKYQAHRNSMNLQHPQPRQGPTGRYQYQLETQADSYAPLSPTASEAEHWASVAEPRMLPSGMDGAHEQQQQSYRASPLSDVYSDSSSAMMELGEEEYRRSLGSLGSNGSASAPPPRPPKIHDDGPLVPERPPKIAMSPAPANRAPTYADHVAAQRGSSLSPGGPTVGRKPSGPRPITSSGQYSPGRVSAGERDPAANVKKNRYRGSPNHIESSSEGSLNY